MDGEFAFWMALIDLITDFSAFQDRHSYTKIHGVLSMIFKRGALEAMMR